MLEGRWAWIGLGAVLAASVSFVNKLIGVVRGKEPRSVLVDETLQDAGFISLGLSLTFDKGTSPRIFLMLGFVLLFGTYVAKRMWAYRRARDGSVDSPDR
jgi:hypothetical protein